MRKKLNSKVPEFRPRLRVSGHAPSSQVAPPPTFRNDFPRLPSYLSLREIRAGFGSLTGVNPAKLDDFSDCEYWMILPPCLDDLHKALKYGLWASEDEAKNQLLSEAYLSNLSEGKRTLLFFKMPKGVLAGVAVMLSPFQDKKLDLWWNHSKSTGSFSIEWLYVKNIDSSSLKSAQLRHSINSADDFAPLEKPVGAQLTTMFHHLHFSPANSVFKDFPTLDLREDLLISARQTTELHIRLQKKEYRSEVPPPRKIPSPRPPKHRKDEPSPRNPPALWTPPRDKLARKTNEVEYVPKPQLD